MIVVDSSERVLKAPSTIGGAAQDASRNACAALDDEIPVGEFPLVDDASVKASLVEATDVPPPQARRAHFTVDGAWRPHNRLVLNSYVEPMEWARPIKDASAPDQETAQTLINYWRPFDQRDLSVVHMHDLYPHNFRVLTVAHGEEYSIPFPINLDKRSYQRVAEDGMYMRNHDFGETVELVWLNL